VHVGLARHRRQPRVLGRMLRKQFTQQVATLERVLEDAPVAA